MAESAAVKIPLDKWGEPPVYFYPDQGIWPEGWLFDDAIEPPCYPSNFHLDPGAEGLKEDDWLRCAPTFPACGWPNGM